MQKTQNRWSVISLSITSIFLQQPSRLPLSSRNPMGGCGGVGGMPQVTPGLLPSHRRQPHTPVDKDTGKKAESPCGTAQASKSPPAAPSLSEPGEGRGGGLHITDCSSRNKWRSLHAEKEPDQPPGTRCDPKPQ